VCYALSVVFLYGAAALHMACANGHLRIVQLLLEANAVSGGGVPGVCWGGGREGLDQQTNKVSSCGRGIVRW